MDKGVYIVRAVESNIPWAKISATVKWADLSRTDRENLISTARIRWDREPEFVLSLLKTMFWLADDKWDKLEALALLFKHPRCEWETRQGIPNEMQALLRELRPVGEAQIRRKDSYLAAYHAFSARVAEHNDIPKAALEHLYEALKIYQSHKMVRQAEEIQGDIGRIQRRFPRNPQAEADLRAAGTERDRLLAEIDTAGRDLAEIYSDIEKANDALAKKLEEIGKADGALTKKLDEIRKAQERLNRLEMQFSSMNSSQEKLASDLDRTGADLRMAHLELEQVNVEIAQKHAAAADLEERVVMQRELETIRGRLPAAQAQEAELARLRSEVKEAEGQKTELDQLRRKVMEADEQKAELARLREQLQAGQPPNPDPNELHGQLQTAQQRIRELEDQLAEYEKPSLPDWA